MTHREKLQIYIEEVSPHIRDFCIAHIEEYERPMRTHPGSQRKSGGKGLHTVQVIEKAIELSRGFTKEDIIEVVEVCLVHDLRRVYEVKLTERQRLALDATKGKIGYSVWRRTQHFRFVVLVLIADMWSAFVNVEE